MIAVEGCKVVLVSRTEKELQEVEKIIKERGEKHFISQPSTAALEVPVSFCLRDLQTQGQGDSHRPCTKSEKSTA